MVIGDFLNLWDKEEALLILSHYMKTDRGALYLNRNEKIAGDILKKSLFAIEERKKGSPLQYILGEWDFYSISLNLNENVLIPRRETEHLIDEALEILKNIKNPKVLDIGTGSGAIALSIKKEVLDAKVYGSDISEKALKVARENGIKNNLDIEFIHSDLFRNIPLEKFDLIISNPPYIGEEEKEFLEIELDFEPKNALFADDSGLEIYKRLIPEARNYLKINGALLLEFGAKQGLEIEKLLRENNYYDIEIKKDWSGFDRFSKSFWR